MKTLYIGTRVLGNLLLFVVYTLVGMNLVNLAFDIVLNTMGKTVPSANDPVHLKIAAITFVFITIVTILYRKYFYMNFNKKEKQEK